MKAHETPTITVKQEVPWSVEGRRLCRVRCQACRAVLFEFYELDAGHRAVVRKVCGRCRLVSDLYLTGPEDSVKNGGSRNR